MIKTKAVLLVGGLGTRLRSVAPSTPKPIVQVGNASFLELIVEQLKHNRIVDLVMCTGYLGEQIEAKFRDGREHGVKIAYSHELEPLGTGGAIKYAERLIEGAQHFIVMNGDSFLQVDFVELIKFHNMQDRLVTMTVVKAENCARYGTVIINSDGKVQEFIEKSGDEVPGLVSAGVYVFRRDVLDRLPEGKSSLEKDLFPKLLGSGGIYAFQQQGMFIDIGTPEDYARAQQIYNELRAAASQVVS